MARGKIARKFGLVTEVRPTKKGEYHHVTVKDKEYFDQESFKVIPFGEELKATIGCELGSYDKELEKCKVGTETQNVLFPKDRYSLEEGIVWVKEHYPYKLENPGARKIYQFRIRGKEPGKPWGQWVYGSQQQSGTKEWAEECGARRLTELKKRWPRVEFEFEIVGGS